MVKENIRRNEIAQVYNKLIHTCNRLGMTNDEIQKQLTVYGRVPFQIHNESWGANGFGDKESFYNGREQVTMRLAKPYTKGTIEGDEEILVGNCLILLSDDRQVIGLHPFEPKPKGEYPITEAFQIMMGDFTLPWKQKDRIFFESTPRWDYHKFFSDERFVLNRYLNSLAWDEFAKNVDKLQEIAQEYHFTSARRIHSFLVDNEEFSSLASLVDCGLLRYYDRNFASGYLEPDKYPLKNHRFDGIQFEL